MISLHPRNTGFAWQNSVPPYQIITQAQGEQYDAQGFFLLEQAFAAEEMDAVAAAIDPFEAEVEAVLRTLPGGKMLIAKADAITFSVHLAARDAVLRGFAGHPVFRKLCADIMGKPSRLYWDQAVYKKPGNPEEFPWHQDNGYTFTEPQQYLTCWVALVDATVDNGCPWVVPGVHRMGTIAHEKTELGWQCLSKPDDAIPVPAKKGDIVVFSSLTPHRTGPNLTDAVRKSYILQYAPDGAIAYPDGAAPEVQNHPVRQFLL